MGRYRHIQQTDATDCGPAALAGIACFHGCHIGLQRLRDMAGTNRASTTLLGLRDAADKLGFDVKAVHGDYEVLPQAPLPAVAHVRLQDGQLHFIVLFEINKHGVTIADPAHEGVEKITHEQFRSMWTGYLLLLAPTDRLLRDGTAPRGPWSRLLALLASQRWALAEAFVCALLLVLLAVASSYALQHVLDTVLVLQDTRLLNALGIGMAVLLVFKAVFGALRQYLLAFVGRQVDLVLLTEYHRHLLGLPLSFFHARRAGEIVSRFHDAEKVREAVSGTTLAIVVDATIVLAMTVLLWLYDLPLAITATAFVPLMILTGLAHIPAVRQRARLAMEHAAQLGAHVVEDVAGVDTVKAFGAERTRLDQGETLVVRLVRATFGLQMLGLSQGSLALLITGAAALTTLWYGGHRVLEGALSIGQLVFLSSLVSQLLDPLERLAGTSCKLQDALVAIDRLGQILDLAPEANAESKASFTGVRHGIELDGVTFRYGGRGNALHAVSLTIPAGKTIALVGSSGCGKTTLVNLLMGFHAPSEGRVLMDGIDLREIERASLRREIGLVAQDPCIFTGTIYANIALARPDASYEDVLAAARAADLDDFISSLPDRYQTVIGERGVNLSGGQRQRLAIARALLRQPSILIFDEATSHLDSVTEQVIQSSLRTSLAGKTVVVVAHRLSTILSADLIYVLDGGHVVEQGTHAELLAQDGRYAALWAAQAELPGPAYRGVLTARPTLNGGGHHGA